MSSLDGTTVLVIGRPTGIARSIAGLALLNRARVIVAGRDADKLRFAYQGGPVDIETVDVTDESSIADLAARLGRVDHVISTASARTRGTVGELTTDAIALSFATKVIGAMLLAKHFTPIMPSDGSFVFTSGTTGRRPSAGMSAVAATNAALDAVTRSLAVEFAPRRFNTVAPGTIDTGAYDSLGEHQKMAVFDQLSTSTPGGRIGRPEDVAQAVIFALTADYLTGTSTVVDGGAILT
jgi:NAD(P)-dependent dehydrogenase (short-subunit alcohol dehydrogenase family)